MAQALFEALAGGVPCTVDSQTAVAVQSLLDSQNTQNIADNQDEEDLFQCGKCKKQFTSLPMFVTHKQTRCSALVSTVATVRVADDGSSGLTQAVASTFTQSLQTSGSGIGLPQTMPGYTTAISSSPVGAQQLTQGIVLNEDIISFTNLDQSLQPQTLQMVTSPFTRPGCGSVSILSPVTTVSSFPSSGSAFTSTVASNQVHLQPAPAQITITHVQADKMSLPSVKPSPTKAGRRSAQCNVLTAVTDGQTGATTKSRKHGTKQLTGQDLDGDNAAKKKLKCQYCEKMFAKNFDLQQHVRAHTGEKPFQCIVCGRAFAQKSNVKKHMATHRVWPSETNGTLPKQPPAVYVEDEAMPDPGPPEKPKETTVVLQDEPGSGDDTQTSESGKQLKVIVDSSYVCQYCPYKFKTYFQLKTHMVQHKEQQVYKCVMKNCGSTFLDLDSFLEHTKTHEDEMSYRCHMCNKYFASLYELGVHQYSHSLYPNQGPKPGPRHFQCTKCMNKYSTPEALEHHMASSTHNYSCPHCDRMFACERYLRRHLPTHGTEGQFECDQCKKRFKTESYLKTHIYLHTGEKPYKCDVCGSCFNRKDRLKRHILIHNSIKKYRCPFRSLTGCQKEFNRPDKLKAHIITHSGIKPFKCKECGKGFSRKPHLIEHERGHRADYKFRCDKCGKGFFRWKLFQDHKCLPHKDGLETQVFRPRNRRKVGHPKKRMITVTAEHIRESRATRGRGRNRQAANHPVPESVVVDVNLDEHKGAIPMTVSMTGTEMVTFDKQNFAITNGKHIQLKGENPAETLLDHYVVHLTETDHGPAVQTYIPTVTSGQVLHATDAATLQPITIIEAQPVHMTVTDGNAELPMMTTVSRADAESMVTTQVVVTDVTGGEHTLVTCPAHLVDYTSGMNVQV